MAVSGNDWRNAGLGGEGGDSMSGMHPAEGVDRGGGSGANEAPACASVYSTYRPTPATGSDWRSWGWQDWAEALLDHYFLRTETAPAAVRSLDVSEHELARVTGDPSIEPAEARERLVAETVSAAAANDRPFWKHAEYWVGWSKPFFLAHLVVACVAVTDASDPDEDSNIERIAQLTKDTHGDVHLEVLPDLWAALARWLDDNAGTYVPLVVPDPGGWRRIGHTVRLAFPSRGDRRVLAECLAGARLETDDPPLRQVIAAVGSNRSRFTRRFVEEFNRFVDASGAGTAPDVLYGLPFWSAVRSVASVHLRGDDARSGRWTLVMEDDEYQVEVRLVTDRPDGDIPTEELEDGYGEWRYGASSDHDDAVERLLGGQLRIGHLGSVVAGGVLPFGSEAHGALELANRRSLDQVEAALVRDELVDPVVAAFGGSARPGPYAGWSLIRGVRLGPDPDVDPASPLSDSPLLGRTLLPPRLSLSGGVRVDGRWLGLHPFLPTVAAPGAARVYLGRSDERTPIPLGVLPDGTWSLPESDLAGDHHVIAEYDRRTLTRTIHFVGAPDSEAFQGPGRPEAWVVEGLARAIRLGERAAEFDDSPANVPAASNRDYLGRDVGVFTDSRSEAAWEITHCAGQDVVRCLVPAHDALPRAASADKGDRRSWRRLLASSSRRRLDHRETIAVSRAIRSTPPALAARAASPRSEPAPRQGVEESARLADAIGATAAIANRRQGFTRREFDVVLRGTLRIDTALAADVTRAWAECGLIEQAASTRWSDRRLFACRPAIEIYNVGDEARGVLRGLCLPTTRAALIAAARHRGMDVTTIPAFSEYIPAGLLLSCDRAEDLRNLADRLGYPCRFLRVEPFEALEGRDLTKVAPGGYEAADPPTPLTASVCLRRWWRRGAPGYWTVERHGTNVTWTHFPEAARFWGCALAGLPLLARPHAYRLDVDNAHLPLTAARWLTALGGTLPGPSPTTGTYSYGSPSPEATDLILTRCADYANAQLTELLA